MNYNDIEVTVIAKTGETRTYETCSDFRKDSFLINLIMNKL